MSGLDEANSVAMGNGLQTFDNAYLPPKTRYITASLPSHRLSLEDVTKFRKHFTGKKRNKFRKKYWYIFVAKTIDLCNFFLTSYRDKGMITRGLETIITCPWSR